MKFSFRLDRLLRLRAQEETERARELGEAMAVEESMRRESEVAREYLERCREQLSESDEVSLAGTLHNLSEAVDAAAAYAQEARENHESSEDAVSVVREAFGDVRRERRVLERYRERCEETWTQDAARTEQKETDEVALETWRKRGNES